VAQWRIELGAEDVAALSRGEQITVAARAVDPERGLAPHRATVPGAATRLRTNGT